MSEPNPVDLVQRLEAQLSPEALFALHTLRELTDAASLDLYLVGGAVRDLLLQRDSVDLDLAIEADVAPIARALASATGGRCVLHERFGTSTVSGPGFHLDLARTRRETYSHPGALPTIEPATIEDDLARRDFTINAMALQLNGAPCLLDAFDGLSDMGIRPRISPRGFPGVPQVVASRGDDRWSRFPRHDIRVLHEASFKDDATRMLRAFRYGARLGFELDSDTSEWMQRDFPYLREVSGPRLRRELQLIFEEPTAGKAANRAEHYGLLRAVHQALYVADAVAERWEAAWQNDSLARLDETGFCIVAGYADDAGVTSLSARLHLAGRFENALRDSVRLRNESSKLAAMRQDPVAAVDTLEHAAPSAVWATGIVAGGDVAATCEPYLREWRHVRPVLRGDDLMALGVQPGVAVGEALRVLRDARLRGETTTRESEETLVRAMLQKTAG